jgi:hypothetical protein
MQTFNKVIKGYEFDQLYGFDEVKFDKVIISHIFKFELGLSFQYSYYNIKKQTGSSLKKTFSKTLKSNETTFFSNRIFINFLNPKTNENQNSQFL